MLRAVEPPVLSCQQWLVLVDRYIDRERRLAVLRERSDAMLRMGQHEADYLFSNQEGDDCSSSSSSSPSRRHGYGHGVITDEDAVLDALLSLEPSAADMAIGATEAAQEALSGVFGGADSAVAEGADLARSVPGRGREFRWPMADEFVGAGGDADYLERYLDDAAMDAAGGGGGGAARGEVYAAAFHAALGRSLMQAKAKIASRQEQNKAAAAALAPTNFESAHHRRLRQQAYGTEPRRKNLTRRPLIVRGNNALRLRQVHSRIAADVHRDRRDFAHAQELQTASAMESIARQRVAELGVEGVGVGGALNVGGEIFDAATSQLVGVGIGLGSPSGSGSGLGRRKPNSLFSSSSSSVSTTNRITRYADLDSGLAATAIADSFLQSSVGQQLSAHRDRKRQATFSLREASSTGPVVGEGGGFEQDDEDDITDAVRSEVAYLLGGVDGDSQAGGGNGQHKTVRERFLELQGRSTQQQQQDKEIFQGWREAKGGVVAEFGPPRSKYSDWSRGPIVR